MRKLYSFYQHKIDNNEILIVESWNTHGETLLSYIRYFQILGYKVSVLVNQHHIQYKSLDCFGIDTIQVFTMRFDSLIFALGMRKLALYKWIFFNSLVTYGIKSVFEWNMSIQKPQCGFIAVQHSMSKMCIYPKDITIISILPNKICKYWVNPHYFGDIQTHTKNKTTTFVVTGKRLLGACKNIDLLFNAVKTLLDIQITNFNVIIIGGEIVDKTTFSDAITAKHIKYLGYLSYPDLYKEIANADFLLPLLDPNNPDHDRYLHDSSG